MLDASRTIAPHSLWPDVRARRDAAIAALDALELADFAEVLSAVADSCYAAEGELSSAWQDKSAGRPWYTLGTALDKLAGKMLPWSR